MIRDVSDGEIAAAAHLAAAAYREDPGFFHLLPDDADRRTLLPAIIEALLRVDAAAGGRARGAYDEGALVGVASALPAGAASLTLGRWLRQGCALRWMLARPAAALRGLALARAVERLRPAAHDHLRLLAVHPAAQGRGVGAALLRDALASGRAVYLAAFTPENAAWSEARGFRRTAEVRCVSRPTFWTLRRPAL